MPHSKTMTPKTINTDPLKPLLKSNIPEPCINTTRYITSLMAAFPRSFDIIDNIPSYYTIQTDPSIKPVQHA